MNPVHYSSKTPEWETPQGLFNELNKEFGFQLDVCASDDNWKCAEYFTKEQDGLSQNWRGRVCWMNPPYGREIGKWVEKAYIEHDTPGESYGLRPTVIVGLLPARTDTRWFHKYIYNKPTVEIRFLKGRLKFGNSKNSAPFPSMIVVWR